MDTIHFPLPGKDNLMHLNIVCCVQIKTIEPVANEVPLNKGKWAGRRRPKVNCRLDPLAARTEAAAKISAASDGKLIYFKAKLEMRRLEHEQRMVNLRLEEQLLCQQIRDRHQGKGDGSEE